MSEDLSLDVLLVTAVSAEIDAMKQAAIALELSWQKRRGAAATYYSLGVLGGQRVGAIKLDSMGSFSSDGSAFTCYQCLAETSASAIIAVGIAFGVDEGSQRVGDVLLARSLQLYDEVDVVDDEAGGYAFRYPSRANVYAARHWVDHFARVGASSGGRVHVGRLLAGGARIESGRFRDELVRRVGAGGDPVIGGEMEAAGIAAACVATNASWAIVKAVADFATRESRARIAETRGPAARAAAEFTLRALTARTDEDLP